MDDHPGRQRPTTVLLRRQILTDALTVIGQRFNQPIDLRTVSREIATSPRQLQRVFAQSRYGSFSHALLIARMEAAARLLRGTDRPVRDVCRAVGYGQPAHFAKAFRRRFGMLPTEYRRRGGTPTASSRSSATV